MPAQRLEVLAAALAEVALLALELGDELVANRGALLRPSDAAPVSRTSWVKLMKGSTTTGFMAVTSLQRLVDPHGIEDAEGLLADLVAQARGAPEHLVEEDAAVHAAQEDQIADLRHIDASGQQIDGDGDVRIALVLEAADELQRLVGGAGDLDDGVVVDMP